MFLNDESSHYDSREIPVFDWLLLRVKHVLNSTHLESFGDILSCICWMDIIH